MRSSFCLTSHGFLRIVKPGYKCFLRIVCDCRQEGREGRERERRERRERREERMVDGESELKGWWLRGGVQRGSVSHQENEIGPPLPCSSLLLAHNTALDPPHNPLIVLSQLLEAGRRVPEGEEGGREGRTSDEEGGRRETVGERVERQRDRKTEASGGFPKKAMGGKWTKKSLSLSLYVSLWPATRPRYVTYKPTTITSGGKVRARRPLNYPK